VGSFVRASSLHVGAAAASAALRRDLVDEGTLPSTTFDEAYAVARLTPGTNLLAMYTLLGERIAGFAGALAALAVGTFIPAVIAVFLAGVYVAYSGNPVVTQAMQGARAGALAVFVWAIIRLIRPQLKQYRRAGVLVAIATLIATIVLPIPQFVVLLLVGVTGAILLRSDM
jgi:chromate transporter